MGREKQTGRRERKVKTGESVVETIRYRDWGRGKRRWRNSDIEGEEEERKRLRKYDKASVKSWKNKIKREKKVEK